MSDTEDRATALAEMIDKAVVFSFPAIASRGKSQVESTSIVGTISQAGSISVTVEANGMANSPKVLAVPVDLGDSAYITAAKTRAILLSDNDINGFFRIAGVGINIQLTARTPANFDEILNIAISKGTALGIADKPFSTTLEEGEAGDTSKLEAILDRNKRAQRWTAGTAVRVGRMKILPSTANGHIYRVVRGGTFSTTEPFSSLSFADKIYDNDVILEDAGVSDDNIYDVNQCIIDAIEQKVAAATRLPSVDGINMTRVFDNLKKLAEYYQIPLLG